jgi:pantoate--beta-alanine ligase
MEIIRTIEWMKQASRAARDQGRAIGLVPTMGALHEGHLSLVRAAVSEHKPVVASVFVNPAQFGPQEDFSKYPRQIEKDAAILESAGVDYLFLPEVAEIYPPGFCTYVNVEGFSDRFEGKSRPGHFRGVTTVVLKLLEIVQPKTAFFGRKDAQQARILAQMARDLNLDAAISVQPIVREPDGLAMSSRNVYLNPEERRAALSISRALADAAKLIETGVIFSADIIQGVKASLAAEPLVRVDYIEIVDEEIFKSAGRLGQSSLLLVAAFVAGAAPGSMPVRLIDNLLVTQDSTGRFHATL